MKPSQFLAIGSALTTVAVAQNHLNFTAITAKNGKSLFECWSSATPFAVSNGQGVRGSQALNLGDASNITLGILPARFPGEPHTAPFKQWVWFTSGLAHITVPDSDQEAWITGGKYGLIFAGDTADISDKGHISTYPGADETAAFQIPTKNGQTPNVTVLHHGPCTMDELVGI